MGELGIYRIISVRPNGRESIIAVAEAKNSKVALSTWKSNHPVLKGHRYKAVPC